MTIQTPRLILRKPQYHDAPLMLLWENDAPLWFISGSFPTYSMFDIEKFIANQISGEYGSQMRLIITETSSGKALGCVDLFDIDETNARAGISILIAEEQNRNRRYATEALQAVCRYAENEMALHQLFCNIHSTNFISQKLFSACGFSRTGTLVQWTVHNNNFIDVYVMQLIFGKHE